MSNGTLSVSKRNDSQRYSELRLDDAPGSADTPPAAAADTSDFFTRKSRPTATGGLLDDPLEKTENGVATSYVSRATVGRPAVTKKAFGVRRKVANGTFDELEARAKSQQKELEEKIARQKADDEAHKVAAAEKM